MRRKKKKAKKPAVILRIVRHFGYNPGRVMREVLEWIETLIVAGVLAFLVIEFVTVRMSVPTGSMFPTIDPADSFFVDKISYYFRSPHPGDIVVFWHTEATYVEQVTAGSPAAAAGVPPGKLISTTEMPAWIGNNVAFSAAGADDVLASLPVGTDIVLRAASGGTYDLGAKKPGANSLRALGIIPHERRVRYVKRLIAVAGQTVQIKDGHVYVNGKPLTGPRFPASRYYYSGLPGIRYGATPLKVPRGKWFVLGDNSGNSLDSRYWGFVDRKDFIGEPYFRIWPFPRFGPMNGYFHL